MLRSYVTIYTMCTKTSVSTEVGSRNPLIDRGSSNASVLYLASWQFDLSLRVLGGEDM